MSLIWAILMVISPSGSREPRSALVSSFSCGESQTERERERERETERERESDRERGRERGRVPL